MKCNKTECPNFHANRKNRCSNVFVNPEECAGPPLSTHPPEHCPECRTRTGGGRCLRCMENEE